MASDNEDAAPRQKKTPAGFRDRDEDDEVNNEPSRRKTTKYNTTGEAGENNSFNEDDKEDEEESNDNNSIFSKGSGATQPPPPLRHPNPTTPPNPTTLMDSQRLLTELSPLEFPLALYATNSGGNSRSRERSPQLFFGRKLSLPKDYWYLVLSNLTISLFPCFTLPQHTIRGGEPDH